MNNGTVRYSNSCWLFIPGGGAGAGHSTDTPPKWGRYPPKRYMYLVMYQYVFRTYPTRCGVLWMWSIHDPMYHHISMHAVEARSRYIQNTFMIHLKTRGPLVLHPHSCVMMYFARRYHAALLFRRNTLIPHWIRRRYTIPRVSPLLTVCRLNASSICIWMYRSYVFECISRMIHEVSRM